MDRRLDWTVESSNSPKTTRQDCYKRQQQCRECSTSRVAVRSRKEFILSRKVINWTITAGADKLTESSLASLFNEHSWDICLQVEYRAFSLKERTVAMQKVKPGVIRKLLYLNTTYYLFVFSNMTHPFLIPLKQDRYSGVATGLIPPHNRQRVLHKQYCSNLFCAQMSTKLRIIKY